MNCPKCQAELVERVTSLQCPNWEAEPSTCDQVPLCKGCLQPEDLCGGGINEYICTNEDCPRTPTENLRDLMNPALHRYRILDFTDGENQVTVNSWVHEAFPEWAGPRARALAIVEEAVELAIATGLNTEEIISAVRLPIIKDEMRRQDSNYVPEGPEGEVGDVYINVLAYAEEIKVDAKKAMNDKMKVNRSRPNEFYLAKTAAKKALGLKL